MADAPPSQSQDADSLFRAALDLHRAGKLVEAAAAYERVVAAAPQYVSAHLNLGVVLRGLRRFGEALASYDRAIALRPDAAGAHNNRGSVLRDIGRPKEALASYARAVALEPRSADALLNQGSVLRVLGRPAEALESYERALALAPDDAAVHAGQASAFFDLARAPEALASYERALAIKPDFADAWRNRAVVLRRLNRPADALTSLDRAIALDPRDAALHRSRGAALEALKRPEEALASYERAIMLKPDLALAHNGRGAALFALGRAEEALVSLDRAIALEPGLMVAHRNRGVALRKLQRLEEAVLSHDRAIALRPESADAYWYRSMCHLTLGRFAEGWRDYERRWEVHEFATAAAGVAPQFRARFDRSLTLEDLAHQDVLVVGEQGVGDVLMFASILPDLLAHASRVSLVCDARLWRLFGHSFPGLELLDAEAATERLPAFGAVLGIASLACLYRNRLDDFPGSPYLAPRPQVEKAWAERLGPADGRRRIGVSWRGGVASTGRSERSMRLAELQPLFDLPNCEFVSLQYGANEVEIGEVNRRLARPIRSFPAAEIDDFEDLAGLVRNLDLVVSVQTALVHLSGACGAPALVMVPATPEWRYTAASPTMPWYGSVKLFRQGADRDWGPVVRRVTEAAAKLGTP